MDSYIQTKNRKGLYNKHDVFDIDIKIEQKSRVNSNMMGKSSDASECADDCVKR